MPLKIEKRCRVCKTIHEGDATLLKRIYASAFYKTGGEPLRQIHDDYTERFTYASLRNHVRLHQGVSERDLKRSALNKLHQTTSNRAVAQVINHNEVRKLVMEQGYKGIKSGRIRLKASDVVKAAKDQADFEFKAKDQALEVMRMMEKFQSGEIVAEGENEDAIDGATSPRQVTSTVTNTG